MSVQSLRAEKESKYFHRNGFRRASWLLLFSLFINLMLIAAIYNAILDRPEPNYYATSGVKAPIRLNPLLTPNYSSTPLLQPDPADDPAEAGVTR